MSLRFLSSTTCSSAAPKAILLSLCVHVKLQINLNRKHTLSNAAWESCLCIKELLKHPNDTPHRFQMTSASPYHSAG